MKYNKWWLALNSGCVGYILSTLIADIIWTKFQMGDLLLLIPLGLNLFSVVMHLRDKDA